jgi:hypothetical protein
MQVHLICYAAIALLPSSPYGDHIHDLGEESGRGVGEVGTICTSLLNEIACRLSTEPFPSRGYSDMAPGLFR